MEAVARLQTPPEPLRGVSLIRVDPRYPGAWETLSGFLADAIERGDGGRDWGVEDMRIHAEQGRVELWALVDGEEIFGASVTCLTTYPKRAVMEILATGTKPHSEDKWRQCLDQLKEIGRILGVSALVGTGRHGWQRKLQCSRTRTVWEIDLGD